ncbi:MAG TPA: hypothetical protein VNY75_09420, partial [Rhizomicrobium sp.]|nr:hypothetical protein [Rhizomicrobium sp.]
MSTELQSFKKAVGRYPFLLSIEIEKEMGEKKKYRKISVGDVFRFGNSEDGWGYGQVIFSKTLQYIVVFEPLFQGEYALQQVIASPILLAGWTMDGRMQSGAWELQGNLKLIAKVDLPQYKVMISDRLWVTDVWG